MALAALLALTSIGTGGDAGRPAVRGEFSVSALDPRNLRVAAPAAIGRVLIAGLREDFDFMVLPAERPNAVRVRVLTGRSPLRVEAYPATGVMPFGAATVANPRD